MEVRGFVCGGHSDSAEYSLLKEAEDVAAVVNSRCSPHRHRPPGDQQRRDPESPYFPSTTSASTTTTDTSSTALLMKSSRISRRPRRCA